MIIGHSLPRPDWNKWGSFVEARLHAAVALSIDLDPDYAVKRANLQPAEYATRFEVAANHGRAGRFEIFTRGEHQDYVDLAEFRAWALGMGWMLTANFPDPRPALATTHEGPCWPWGNYQTPHLKAFADAGNEFFSRPIPKGDEPKSETVSDWLEARGVPHTMAVMMARIFRDPETPAGPRREPTRKR